MSSAYKIRIEVLVVVHVNQACAKRRGRIGWVLNSAPFSSLFRIGVAHVNQADWAWGPHVRLSDGPHQWTRIFLFFLFYWLLSLTGGPYTSAEEFNVPRLHPDRSWTFAKCPQLCVPHCTSRTCFIFIKLYVLRFSVYFISKFMVFNVEFNHKFYYVESPFYFWDFKALSSF